MPFVKGQSGNPGGRRKGTKDLYSLDALRIAIREVEQEKKVNLLKHFIRRALESDSVLLALMKKFIPDIEHKDEKNGEELINETLEFKDIPSNGEGLSRFEKFIKN